MFIISYCGKVIIRGGKYMEELYEKETMKELEKEYLRSQLDVFNEERKNFIEETKYDDISMTILKTHLYIQKEMTELTNIFFKNANVFKEDYTFAHRLNLLYALGVIDKELYDPIRRLNSIRNKIGHNLNYTYSEKEYISMYDTLSNEILGEFKKDLKLYKSFSIELDHISKTKILLAGLWIAIKSKVLFSFVIKREIAHSYKIEALDKLTEFK